MEDEQSKNMVWESTLLLEIAILACILGLKFIFLMCTEGKHLDECLANEPSWFSFYLGWIWHNMTVVHTSHRKNTSYPTYSHITVLLSCVFPGSVRPHQWLSVGICWDRSGLNWATPSRAWQLVEFFLFTPIGPIIFLKILIIHIGSSWLSKITKKNQKKVPFNLSMIVLLP